MEMGRQLKGVRFIDLFAGIGGFHQAMESYGAKCVFAAEWDKECQSLYEENYGILPFGDITKIEEAEVPNHDVICAGFPCQAFSISGKQRGFLDTRGTLFFDVARIAALHKPKLLILENVKNFARHDEGKTMKVVLTTLEGMGYKVFHKVLNASHYGVPQKRERVYILAFREDLDVKEFTFPSPIDRRVKVEDILENNKDFSEFEIHRSDVKLKNVEILADVLGHYPAKPIRLGIVNKGGQGERIYSPLGHAITLSAYGGGVGAKTGIYKVNDVLRKLTPRECARLTGFPEDFVLHERKNVSYRQFGNSVVVDVLKAIIGEVVKLGVLEKKHSKKKTKVLC